MPAAGKALFEGQDTLWSPDRAYRYFLRRPADLVTQNLPPIAFLLLNPSTADEIQDDPTIRRCRGYGRDWRFGEVMILNAFAYRATDPRAMRAHREPVGPENDAVISETCAQVFAQGGMVVCGWGNHGQHLGRSDQVRELLAGKPAQAFPLTKAGEPGHPLYLRKDVALELL